MPKKKVVVPDVVSDRESSDDDSSNEDDLRSEIGEIKAASKEVEEDEEESGSDSGSESDEDDGDESARWRKRPMMPVNSQFSRQFSDPPTEPFSPLEYFKLFWIDEAFELISEETNRYSVQQTGKSIDTSPAEIRRFVGVLMHMSIVQVPYYRMYWDPKTRYQPIAESFTINRFDKIKQFLHFNNNEEMPDPKDPNRDKLFKIRPLHDIVLQQCRKIEPEEYQSIDEEIIPYKGTFSGLRQYLPKKPKKWGFKVISRHGISGISYDFIFYQGKGTVQSEDPKIGISGQFVMKLCETLPHFQNFKVYFDNWFSSVHLVNKLHIECGIWATGTIRSNRCLKCPLKTEKELSTEGRGSFDWKVDYNRNVCLVKFYDNRSVQLVSSFVGVEPVGECERWDKKGKKHVKIAVPAIVKDYNKHMGGVDLFDMLMSLYRLNKRGKKYYFKIFIYFLQVGVVNGWLLYRRHLEQLQVTNRKSRMNLLNFMSEIAGDLQQVGLAAEACGMGSRKRGRPSNEALAEPGPSSSGLRERPLFEQKPTEKVRHDRVDHLVIFKENRGRCANCPGGKGYHLVNTHCVKCKVYLCCNSSRDCFYEYHTPKE